LTGSLVCLFLLLFQDVLVDGFAAAESFLHGMPVSDFLFAELPAQEDDAVFDYAGEVEQAHVEVFHLHTGGIDFAQRVLDLLCGLRPAQCSAAYRPRGKRGD
jgi:hypothetical protein